MAESWDPEEVLMQYLGDNYPWPKIEIEGVKITGAIPAKAPDTIIVEKGPIGKGEFTLLFDDGEKMEVKADVRALDNVVKSRRPFKKGYVLNSEDIYVSEMDIRRMPKSSVQDPEEIIGKPLRRSIIANTTLTENMVEKSQVVDKGKPVTLLIHSRGFDITASGETKEKGYVGMTVKAINISSKKEVRGVLIDERTVEVEL
jgi:flagella basal body P-ring formation protein FlgA